MSIKFICSCGKHLRARDEMAARRSFCPACGSPVGVPSLKPTHGGTDAAPLSPAERRARARQRQQEPIPADEPAEEVVWPAPRRPARPEDLDLSTGPRTPLDPSVVRQVVPDRPKHRQREWTFETHWSECVVYAFRAFPIVIWLAIALSMLAVGLAAWLEKPP